MKQAFAYEPPSARRGLMKNSDSDEDIEEKQKELEELRSLIRTFILESKLFHKSNLIASIKFR